MLQAGRQAGILVRLPVRKGKQETERDKYEVGTKGRRDNTTQHNTTVPPRQKDHNTATRTQKEK